MFLKRDEIATKILAGMAAGHLGAVLKRENIKYAVDCADILIEELQRTEGTSHPAEPGRRER